MATFLTPGQPIFLTPRQAQIDELLRTRERQIAEMEERLELLGRFGWAARALIRSQVGASGRSQESNGWRRQAVTSQRVWRDLCSNSLADELIALSAVEDALDELHARELAQRQRKVRRDSPSMYVWKAPWLP